MNIFATDNCPIQSAVNLNDRHAVKMFLESMQMMATIADYLGFDSPYRPVMLNHPCTIWARESKQNFQWLWDHAVAIAEVYSARYDRVHKCEITMNEYEHVWNKVLDSLPDTELTDFAIAISPSMRCRHLPNFDELSTVEKYRMYYIYDKDQIAVWSYPHSKPTWYKEDWQ